MREICLEFGRSRRHRQSASLMSFGFPIENNDEFYSLDHSRPLLEGRVDWVLFTDKTLCDFTDDIIRRSGVLGFREEYLISRSKIQDMAGYLIEIALVGRTIVGLSETISRVIEDPDLDLNGSYKIGNYRDKKSI